MRKMGWQALVATKAEGLFPLAASLPLPSRSLAAQTTAQTSVQTDLWWDCKLWLLQMRLQTTPTFGVASSACHKGRRSFPSGSFAASAKQELGSPNNSIND
ncbi:MAG: hypothetical protein PHU48_03675 [Candidatus Cloacimonetes bacterium]|nr:hypothetical protein [Candidatus Cloacimonadota bacterium]